jgi:hypothetical protein
MEGDAKKKSSNVRLLTVFLLCIASVLVVNYRHFFVEKNYQYLVEAPCDSSQETCFVRDCAESPDECGVNTFSPYKEYYLSARDFSVCGTTACATECTMGEIACEPIECDATAGDSCESPETTQ